MRKEKTKAWFLLLVSLITALSILCGAALAASGGDASGTLAPDAGEEDQDGTSTDGGTGDTGDGSGETGTDGTEENGETGTETETEPEPTLEELRDELMAILGTGEETAAIQSNIDRLIALGDPSGTLRTYLEGMIQLHQLQYEQEQLQATLEQLETADETLGAIGQAVTAMENPDEALRRVEEEISDQAARLLEQAEYDGTGDLAALVTQALSYLDSEAAGADSADMAAILLFAGLRDGEFLNDAGLVTAEDAIASHFSNILSRYAGLSARDRQNLESASEDIAGRANNAQSMDPSVLVAAGDSLALTLPVFTYSDTIMISLEDAAAFLGGEVVEMADNATVVIQAPDAVLEMTRGSSDAYLNDQLLKMAQPVLSFDKVCYLPLDTMLQCCGMERMTVGGYELLYPAP